MEKIHKNWQERFNRLPSLWSDTDIIIHSVWWDYQYSLPEPGDYYCEIGLSEDFLLLQPVRFHVTSMVGFQNTAPDIDTRLMTDHYTATYPSTLYKCAIMVIWLLLAGVWSDNDNVKAVGILTVARKLRLFWLIFTISMGKFWLVLFVVLASDC